MSIQPYPLGSKDRTIFEFGLNEDTHYSRNPDYIPSREDIFHLVSSGRLIRTFYDYEASDKDARTASPIEFSGLAFDLNGRLLARAQIPIRFSDHESYAPVAALVGRISPARMKQGWPPDFAAAMIQDFHRRTSLLNEDLLGTRCEELRDGRKGFRLSYGTSDDPIRIEVQENGRKFRFEDEEKWHNIYAQSEPFNGENYDDPMASHWFARLGMADLFVSSQKQMHTVRIDAWRKAIWEWAFGLDETKRIAVATRFHQKTKREVLNTRLGSLVLGNTTNENRKRGLAHDGIRYFDGREPDPDFLHSALEDATATAALSFYLRKIDPEGMRFVENVRDGETYKNLLTKGTEQGFHDRPPLGFVRYDQGQPSRGIGVLLRTDEAYGNWKRALLFNLDHDPSEYAHRSDSEIKALLAQRNNNPVFIPVAMNKTVSVAMFDRAYAAGAGELPVETYYARRLHLISQRSFSKRAMRLYKELVDTSRPINLVTQRDPAEDSYTPFNDLQRGFYLDEVTGQKKVLPKDIWANASDRWNFMRKFDDIIRRLTEAHSVLYSKDESACHDYIARYKACEKKLAELTKGWKYPLLLPDVGISVENNITAAKHLWLMRHACASFPFYPYMRFFVVNERNQRLAWPRVLSMPDDVRKRSWPILEDEQQGPHLKINFDLNNTFFPILTLRRAFVADAFYKSQGDKEWLKWWNTYFDQKYKGAESYYESLVTMAVQGPPNLDASEHPKMTEAKAINEIEEIITRAPEDFPRSDKESDYRTHVLGTPEGQRLLHEHKKEKEKRLQEHKWTPDLLHIAGYDPLTRRPLHNVQYTIFPENILVVKVPETMLSHTYWEDTAFYNSLVIARPDRAFEKALMQAHKKDKHIVLQGEATGRLRLAARAICQPLDGSAGSVNEMLSFARMHYATSSLPIRLKKESVRLLTFEALYPIHSFSARFEGHQHVPVSSLDWGGLVSRQAGGLPAPLGLMQDIIIRDLGETFDKGLIRLRRMKAGEETGDEYLGCLEEAHRIKVRDLLSFTDEQAFKAGMLSGADFYSKYKRIFSNLQVQDADKQNLHLLRLRQPVRPYSYRFCKRDVAPTAQFERKLTRTERRNLFSELSQT